MPGLEIRRHSYNAPDQTQHSSVSSTFAAYSSSRSVSARLSTHCQETALLSPISSFWLVLNAEETDYEEPLRLGNERLAITRGTPY